MQMTIHVSWKITMLLEIETCEDFVEFIGCSISVMRGVAVFHVNPAQNHLSTELSALFKTQYIVFLQAFNSAAITFSVNPFSYLNCHALVSQILACAL